MKKEWTKKLLALALSLVVAVTFVPLLGDSVFAEGEGDGDPAVVLDNDSDNDLDIVNDEAEAEATEENENVTDVTPVDEPVSEVTVDNEATAPAEGATDMKGAEGSVAGECNLLQLGALASDEFSTKGSNSGSLPGLSRTHNYFSGTISQSGNIVTINVTLDSNYFRFDKMYVDGKEMLLNNASVTSSSLKNITINMTNFETGYHTVYMYVALKKATNFYDINENLVSGTKNQRVDILGQTYMASNNISETPNYNGRFYYVYSNYIDYFPFNFGCNQGSYNMYMEYSANGGKSWGRTSAMKADAIKLLLEQRYTFKGFSANKAYKTRLRYGEYVTYSTDYFGDGKSYFFGGPVRNLGTIKTGAAQKPKIKSIKVKAVKVKRHKIRHYGYYTGVYLYTEKFYTYKLKVTVKLKKKPGTGGLWINGKFAKGNKKKYTVTLPGSSYSVKKPKGKKFTVSVCSYQSSSYGGLSPLYQKKKKIK